MIETLAVLGASGDLTGRYLMPALAQLDDAEMLPEGLEVIGIDRQDRDDDAFRADTRDRLRRHAPRLPQSAVEGTVSRLRYRRADVTDAGDLEAALDGIDRPVVVYLALPNTLFLDTLRALAAVKLPEGSQLVVEKPFGSDLEDARRLNKVIRTCFREEDVFRVDHFLAEQTVLNVLGLRFANRVFEPIWNALHVRAVDIIWDETLALEGRAGYYDRAGALKDMIQNHLLQMLALTAMEPPTSLGERDLRDRKVEVLRAVRAPSREDMARLTRRARYTAGTVEGRSVPAYVDEPDVDADLQTETYAEVILSIDNWRWSGVPFRLRTGKALGADRREVTVHFHRAPHQPFPGAAPADELRFLMSPDAVALEINLNGAGEPFELERARLVADFPERDLPPYALLLRAILDGDPTLSIRGDEAEESWRVVEPVLDAWSRDAVPLQDYPAGSSGP